MRSSFLRYKKLKPGFEMYLYFVFSHDSEEFHKTNEKKSSMHCDITIYQMQTLWKLASFFEHINNGVHCIIYETVDKINQEKQLLSTDTCFQTQVCLKIVCSCTTIVYWLSGRKTNKARKRNLTYIGTR